MVATLQHACNRRSDTNPSLFRNDNNNVAALQSARLQKKLMEETSRLQQEQLVEADQNLRTETVNREKIQQERDELLREMEIQKKLMEETARLQQEQLKEADQNIERLKQAVSGLGETVSGLEQKVPNSRQDNCLPFQYHNSTVMIVNLRSQMALDAAKDGNDKVHAWEFNIDNLNQIFTLAKVSNDANPDSYWTITRKDNGRKLYFPNGGTGGDVHAGSGPGKQGYWLIGRGSRVGSWIIKNAEWGTYIELENSDKVNGTRVKSYDFHDNLDANWVIIPLNITN